MQSRRRSTARGCPDSSTWVGTGSAVIADARCETGSVTVIGGRSPLEEHAERHHSVSMPSMASVATVGYSSLILASSAANAIGARVAPSARSTGGERVTAMPAKPPVAVGRQGTIHSMPRRKPRLFAWTGRPRSTCGYASRSLIRPESQAASARSVTVCRPPQRTDAWSARPTAGIPANRPKGVVLLVHRSR